MALNRNEVGLQFTLSVDLGNSVRQLQSFQDQIRATAKRIQVDMAAAADTIRKTTQAAADQTKRSVTDLTGAMANLGNVLTVGVTAPLVGLGAAAIKSAVDLDKTRARLAALTGSTEEANRVIARLRELVAVTPGLTSRFAQESFAQLKSLGTIGEESILRLTGALGRLNAVFSLEDPSKFIRNIQQIFSQGFERDDIKEALGQVPIFEQLLEQAFGTKDAAKLRQLKDAGKLTAETYFAGITEAIETDRRFANAQESIAARFEKLKDRIATALVPLGEQLLAKLIPVIEKIIPIVTQILDKFNSLSPATQDLIIKAGLLAAALGPSLRLTAELTTAFSSLGTLLGLGGQTGLIAQVGSLATRLGALALANPVTAAALAGLAALGGLFVVLKMRMADLNEETQEFLNKQKGLARDIKTGELVGRPGRITDEQAAAIEAARRPLQSGMAVTLDMGTTADPNRANRIKDQLAKDLAATTGEQKKTIGRTIDFQKLVRQIVEEDNRQQLRIIEAQTGQRLALLKQRYDAEQISQREFGAESLRLQMEQANREMAALGAEGDRLTREQARTKSAEERLTIERELVRVAGEQAVKLIEIDRLLQERAQRETLPLFQIDPAQVQQAIEQVDPLLQAFRDRQKARAEEVARLEVDAIRTRTEIIKIENQVDLGMMTRTQAQERINALLKQERDQRIAALQVQLQALDISEQQRASLEQQIVAMQTQGETMRSMGIGDALQSVFESIRQPAEMVQDALMGMKAAGQQALEVMILTGQFSGQAFMKAAKQAIAAMTAEAAVAAIMHIAKGFAFLAIGQPANAATAFKAAAAFKLVGTIAGGAAASLALNAIAPGGANESGGTGGRFVTGGGGQPQTISLIQGQQGNRREPQVVIIRAEMEPGVVIRKVADSYKENGEMRQLIRQDILQGAI